MPNDKVSAIMEEYFHQHGLYTDFSKKAEGLIQELLKQNGIRVHSITSRVKDPQSLHGKLNRSNGKYTQLSQITDLVGIRIITYFEDEIDAIANIIEKEFHLDVQNSVDKRQLHDPVRFGYMSLHYVVELPEKRAELTEYARFRDCKVEIQVRSILQHTWAEIEHDLGYKTKQAIPKEIRRSFSRLAGLLELADLEFARIRDQLEAYENEVPQQITETPAQVLIDQTSLKSYILHSPLIEEIDLIIVNMVGANIMNNEHFIGQMVSWLHYYGMNTISDVDACLRENKEMVIKFAHRILSNSMVKTMNVGASLMYLCYVLGGRSGSIESIYGFMDLSYMGDDEMREQIAKEILLTYHLVASSKELPLLPE
jgi:ppGpp synthetase/RelA/SpoT-type nucleotidyltranferase